MFLLRGSAKHVMIFLCAKCFKIHTMPLPSRNHVLIDKASMHQSALKARNSKNMCTIICPNHNDRVIEFYCTAHNSLLCGICAVMKHKLCENVYIPDVADKYKEFKLLVDALCRLKKDIGIFSINIKETCSLLTETRKTILLNIRQFRNEINGYLDKKEEKLSVAIKKMEQQDTALLTEIAAELHRLKTTTSDYRKQLK